MVRPPSDFIITFGTKVGKSCLLERSSVSHLRQQTFQSQGALSRCSQTDTMACMHHDITLDTVT